MREIIKARSQKYLTITWFGLSGLIFTILIFQTFLGKYGSEVDKAWGWFLPTILPALSLIIYGFIEKNLKNEKSDNSSNVTIEIFFHRLCMGLSLFYLLCVFATLLIHPLTEIPALELMDKSNLFLGPLQGLTSGFLAAFFNKS